MEDASVLGRVSGALRRTPSPQQLFDGASRRVAAGVAAAGAAVGGALSSIREEDRGHYEDHTRWSEEAAARASVSRTQSGHYEGARQLGSTTQPQLSFAPKRAGDRRKAVAIVVSAERKHHGNHDDEVRYIQTHAVSRIHVVLPSGAVAKHLASLSYPTYRTTSTPIHASLSSSMPQSSKSTLWAQSPTVHNHPLPSARPTPTLATKTCTRPAKATTNPSRPLNPALSNPPNQSYSTPSIAKRKLSSRRSR